MEKLLLLTGPSRIEEKLKEREAQPTSSRGWGARLAKLLLKEEIIVQAWKNFEHLDMDKIGEMMMMMMMMMTMTKMIMLLEGSWAGKMG